MSKPNTTTDKNQGADTQTAENSTAADDKNKQAQTSATQAEPAKTTEEGSQKADKTFSQEEVNRLLAKERRDWEKKANDAEAKAKLSDDERVKAELEDYKSQLRERDARDVIKDEAQKLGAKNTTLVYRALQSEIEFDDAGKVKNLKELFEMAKADFPELFGVPKPDGKIDAGAKDDDKPVKAENLKEALANRYKKQE